MLSMYRQKIFDNILQDVISEFNSNLYNVTHKSNSLELVLYDNDDGIGAALVCLITIIPPLQVVSLCVTQ